MSGTNDHDKNKKLKHVKVYNELYELIQNGTYAPGSQLPPENTLSTTMNVSRMTLRKALTLLREDGLVTNVPGIGHFVRKDKSVTQSDYEANIKEVSPNKTLPHPIHNYCMESIDDVEFEFRIEPPSKAISDSFDDFTAAVVITDRWYKHETHSIAYSLSFIPIETVGQLHIDLNHPDTLLDFLEHTCYESGHHYKRTVTHSTAGNFTAKNYKLSNHDSFMLIQEKVSDAEGHTLAVSKHYIPLELFELKISA